MSPPAGASRVGPPGATGNPTDDFAAIAGFWAFYPALMDDCRVDGERVVPQAGGFYGGWITSRMAGPFKGPPGTQFW